MSARRAVGPALALLVALLLAPCAPRAATAPTPADWHEQLDRLVRQGYDEPEAALRALQAAQPDPAAPASRQRAWWLARGLVEARAGMATAAAASAERLIALRQAHADPMATADAELVRAVVDDNAGRLARAAADGVQVAQRQHWQAAATLARAANDPYREAWALALLASAHAQGGEFDAAMRLIGQAGRVAAAYGTPEVQARVKLSEARIQGLRGDRVAAQRLADEGLKLARAGGAKRLEGLFLINLSDDLLALGRPREALEAIERAQPLVRRYHEARAERTLLHNASLARLALHQVAAAKRDFAELLKLWATVGDGEQAEALREFGDALAAAGDTAGALELYHRERKLAADIMARNRETALHELQARFDREAQQRNIELLERDNALKTAQLESRTLLQRVWLLLAITITVAVAFAVLLYLRVRETQRQLERSQARLRVQSERDPLTGLANRRHFQDVMRQRGAAQAFEGGLLLVDIDHFKHVNDRHGHAAGDEVLIEVARRLSEAVRGEDLVVRWGGEEFLVYAPRLDTDALQVMAERLLVAVGGTPVQAADQPLAVSISIGHALFPLAPDRPALGWERALNLVDMALYTAKTLGRRRAVGIRAVQARDTEALLAVERDFERAWTEGRVVLQVTEGP